MLHPYIIRFPPSDSTCRVHLGSATRAISSIETRFEEFCLLPLAFVAGFNLHTLRATSEKDLPARTDEVPGLRPALGMTVETPFSLTSVTPDTDSYDSSLI